MSKESNFICKVCNSRCPETRPGSIKCVCSHMWHLHSKAPGTGQKREASQLPHAAAGISDAPTRMQRLTSAGALKNASAVVASPKIPTHFVQPQSMPVPSAPPPTLRVVEDATHARAFTDGSPQGMHFHIPAFEDNEDEEIVGVVALEPEFLRDGVIRYDINSGGGAPSRPVSAPEQPHGPSLILDSPSPPFKRQARKQRAQANKEEQESQVSNSGESVLLLDEESRGNNWIDFDSDPSLQDADKIKIDEQSLVGINKGRSVGSKVSPSEPAEESMPKKEPSKLASKRARICNFFLLGSWFCLHWFLCILGYLALLVALRFEIGWDLRGSGGWFFISLISFTVVFLLRFGIYMMNRRFLKKMLTISWARFAWIASVSTVVWFIGTQLLFSLLIPREGLFGIWATEAHSHDGSSTVCDWQGILIDMKKFYGEAVDFSRLQILYGGIPYHFGDDSAMVVDETIYLSAKYCPSRAVMAHELVHVWQSQHRWWFKSGSGRVWGWIGGMISCVKCMYDYGGNQGLADAQAAGKILTDFGPEQQAQIIQDFYTDKTSTLHNYFASLLLGQGRYILYEGDAQNAGSCVGLCGEATNASGRVGSIPCYCNVSCVSSNDCCNDFSTVCLQ